MLELMQISIIGNAEDENVHYGTALKGAMLCTWDNWYLDDNFMSLYF